MPNHLHAIGIMTGNSLDGADLVLTRFGCDDAAMVDLATHSVPFPEDLKDDLRAIRAAVNAAEGWVARAVANLGAAAFDRTLGRYTTLLAGAVADLRTLVGAEVDLIGLHGQTCAHRPPSIAGAGDAYTVQLGDGQGLADRTGITVVDDFRSDDLMAGGEGAPLAPLHHRHLAEVARAQGRFPIAFCNGGNTGNVSVISVASASGEPATLGWDTGPFNHFPDRLMQLEAGRPCDLDGAVGRRGTIDLGLLGLLFREAVVTGDGGNFLLRPPPKSSDPEWYRLPPELLGQAAVDGRVLPFEDRVRTATYFATYAFAHSLALIPPAIEPPMHFATCGGGWRNPLCPLDFRALLAGDHARAPVLPEHADHFARLAARTASAVVEPSSALGIDATAMEARIFADAAVARIKGDPFTLPATTGAARPTVCGVIRFPLADPARITPSLRAWLDHFATGTSLASHPDPRWSRATAGWRDRLAVRVDSPGAA